MQGHERKPAIGLTPEAPGHEFAEAPAFQLNWTANIVSTLQVPTASQQGYPQIPYAVVASPRRQTRVPYAPVETGHEDALVQGGQRLADLNRRFQQRCKAHSRLVRTNSAWKYASARTETALGSADGYADPEVRIPAFDLLNAVGELLHAAEQSLSNAVSGQRQELQLFAWRANVAEMQLQNYDQLLREYREREKRGRDKLGTILTGAAAATSSVLTFGAGALPAALATGGAAAATRVAIEHHQNELDGDVIRWSDLAFDATRDGLENGLPVFVGMKVFTYLASALPFYLGQHAPEALLIEIGAKLGFTGPIPRDLFAQAMHTWFAARGHELASLGSAVGTSALTASVAVAVEQLYREPEQAMTVNRFIEIVGNHILASAGLQLLILAGIRGARFVAAQQVQGSRELPSLIPWHSDGQPGLVDRGADWPRRGPTPEIRPDLAIAAEWLSAYGRSRLPPDYQPIFEQYLWHRAAHPIASPELRNKAIDARTAMKFVHWLRAEANDALAEQGHVFTATFHWWSADKLVQAADAIISRGHLSAHDLDNLVETYLLTLGASPLRHDQRFFDGPNGGWRRYWHIPDQRPPARYLRRPFEVPESNPWQAMNIPARSVGPRDHTWTVNEDPSPGPSYTIHDDNHNEFKRPTPRSPGNLGNSAVHDFPIMMRQADFEGTIQAIASGMDEGRASHLQRVYWVLTHEFAFSPQPEYLLARGNVEPEWIIERGVTSFAEEGKTVSPEDMAAALAMFDHLCDWYLAAFADGRQRMFEGNFRNALAKLGHDLPEATGRVRLHVNAKAPSVEDYKLFMFDDRVDRNKPPMIDDDFRGRVRAEVSSEEQPMFDNRYGKLTLFINRWAMYKASVEGQPIHIEKRVKPMKVDDRKY